MPDRNHARIAERLRRSHGYSPPLWPRLRPGARGHNEPALSRPYSGVF